ncbi:MAG: anhydro-N-acetylmuramic acid kinase, partial [Candidatus Binatia bacterium]
MLTRRGVPFDADGATAASGHSDESALEALLSAPYFDRSPPKSLDRLDFTADALAGLGTADGAATLVAFTCRAVARSLEYLPEAPRRWLVTGGGRKNLAMMAGLAAGLGAPVGSVEEEGWDGDALEAQAFAFLAVRSRLGLSLTLPATTGVSAPTTGGRLFRAR